MHCGYHQVCGMVLLKHFKPCSVCSLTLPFLFPCGRMKRRTGGTKGELCKLRWEQFTGNGNKTLRVAATMLMKVFTRKAPNVETGYVQTGNGQTVNAQTGNVQTCHSAWLKKPFPFPPTVLWGCVAQPLLATSNIHPALARTRARCFPEHCKSGSFLKTCIPDALNV